MNRIGIMQGRLTPRRGAEGLHRFPVGHWREEFEQARRLGIDHIEWVLDGHDNPLWSEKGREEIRRASVGVSVSSVCANFFSDHSVLVPQNLKRLALLLGYAADIGASVVLLPLLENASVKDPVRRERMAAALGRMTGGARLGVEADVPGPELAKMLTSIANPLVGAYYDTGNAMAAGLDPSRDVDALAGRIVGVHIKDRKRGGPNCWLGSGDVDFASFLMAIRAYEGPLVLEHYFEDHPEETAAEGVRKIREWACAR